MVTGVGMEEDMEKRPLTERGVGGLGDRGEAVDREGRVGLRTGQEGGGEPEEDAGAETHCRCRRCGGDKQQGLWVVTSFFNG
jgi:hypothetical protein